VGRGGAALIEPWVWASGGAVLGAIIGSFLATIVSRWPEGGSVREGRSRCDSCKKDLQPRDLVPIFSALWLRGRCRYCGAAIAPHHLVIEVLAAMIGAAALLIAPDWTGFAGAIFGWLLLLLAALDLQHYWVPDRITVTMATLGILVGALGTIPALSEPLVYPFLSDRIIGAVLGFLALAAIALAYRAIRKREGLGGGDPKMFGAIGAWVGWQGLPNVLLGATMIGLLFVLTKALRREKVNLSDRLPLGAMMALAAFPIWIWMQ
jgi:leader peptidase (prepilin peptidase)/N-methyltransferase